MASQHLGITLTDQSFAVQGAVQTQGRNTAPFSKYPTGYECGKRLRKMQTDAKAECKATGRHCSGQKEEILAHHAAHLTDLLATGTLGLAPHLTDHSDLHGNKYIFNLSCNSVTTAYFWGNK